MADETKPKKPAKEPKPEGAAAAANEKPAVEKAAGDKPVAEKAEKPAKTKKAPAAAANETPASPEITAGTAPTAAELLGDEAAGKKIIKAKGSKNIVTGIANILATFNNTQVAITDMQGNVIGWSSAGRVGF